MSTITRFIKFSIPICFLTNIPLDSIHLTALAKPACFSKNIYQEKSLKCQESFAQKKARLFSIYSNPKREQKQKVKPAVKAFGQWNKNISPTFPKAKLELKTNIKVKQKNRPLKLTPDKYPNLTLISNAKGQHAITILSSVKVAMATNNSHDQNTLHASLPIQNASLAALHIRCIENTTSVMFEFPNTRLANAKASTEILYSIDNGPDRLLGLSRSKGENILGLWSGKKAVPFTSKILGKTSLRINVWDKESVEYKFAFDIKNLGEAIHNLRNACNW